MSDRDRVPERSSSSARDTELSGRLHDLSRRLGERRNDIVGTTQENPVPRKPGVAMAMRLASDFVAGVIVGAALGWGFDRLFGTSPWGLVVLLLLGFAAGLLSVMRSAGLIRPRTGGADQDRDGT